MARNRSHIPVEKQVEVQERRKRVLELRLAGKSQAQIVAETGWSKQTVSRDLRDAIHGITRENAEEYVELELSRLDEMWAAIWPRIVKPETSEERKAQPWLMDRAFEIIEKRAKLTGTYKTAELKAIAAAKGNTNSEGASMIVDLFGMLKGALGDGEPTGDNSDPDSTQ